jgi:hypothetical protein
MGKLAILATVAIAFAAPAAQADGPPRGLTIEIVRMSAAANVPIDVDQIDWIMRHCGVRVFGGGPFGMSSAEQTDIIAEAQTQHVIPSTVWLRRNDALLAKCLPSAPLAN